MTLLNKELLFNVSALNNIINNEEQLFENKINCIEDVNLKSSLTKILKARLSGILPQLVSGNNYNWEIYLDQNLNDYLHDFDKCYFSDNYSENLDINFNNNIIFPIINNLKSMGDKFKSICFSEIKNPKELFLIMYESSNCFHKAKINLEYSFLINKLKKFIELIYIVYPNLLTMDIQNQLTKPIGFNEFIHLFVSNISNSIRKHIENIVNKDIKIMNEMFGILMSVEKNIKTLFWIVYSHDIKHVDLLLKIYHLSDEYIEEVEKQIYSSDEKIQDECNQLLDKINSIKEEFIESVETKIYNIPNYLSLSDQELSNYIDSEINDVINNISDSDEQIIIKKSLEECKEIIKLDMNIGKTIDILSVLFKK